MKQLLRSDIIPIQMSQKMINESKTQNGGRLILKNIILQRADAQNQNGRIYPKRILMREADIYNKNNVKIKNAIGELDHPESSVVSLKHGALNIIKMWWNGNDLMGDVEILTHLPNGQILEGYLAHDITIGISSRGLGSVKESQMKPGTVEVEDDFQLLAFDAVSTPSTHGAYMNLTESKNPNIINEYNQALSEINSLINEIIF
jgi:hypothetical protein